MFPSPLLISKSETGGGGNKGFYFYLMTRYNEAVITDLPETIQKVVKGNVITKTSTNNYGEETTRQIINKGLFLFGNTGSGKTHALHALKNFTRSRDVENWVELLFELKGKFDVKDGVRTLIDSLTEQQYIFLDDIGAEKQTEWSQEMLYLIINRAYNYNKTLFISSNLNESEFVAKYGDRIFDRIQEICELIIMPKINHRQK